MSAGRVAMLGGVVLLVAGALATVAAPAGALHDGPGAGQQTVDADTVSLRIGLQADGTAAWQVTYRIELDDENATAAFESLQSDIESDSGPYVDRFESRMQRAMWTAENATGREMAIDNVSVEARTESLPQGEYGVVVYRLDWTNFAVVEGETIRAGDAIDEFFLDSQTSLTIAWPEDYGLISHEPGAESVGEGSVTWQGRLDFGRDEPRVEIEQGAGGETPGAGGVPVLPLAVVVLIVLGTGGWLYYRRGGGPPSDTGGEGPAVSGAESGGGGATAEGPPPELLSNEERVLRLLEQHGGRIKQQQVAEELDWTDAKTSQVVSDLREADEVESFRLGRENVLTLPEVSIEGELDESRAESDGEDEGERQ
jgi:uncharacterized membrane protein